MENILPTILIEKNVMVPMRDGVQLATDIYRLQDAPPAPVLIARGTTPRMNARDVMTMGRKRSRAASTAACTRLMPSRCMCAANSTIKIAFFAARPTSVTSPTCRYKSL